MIAGNTYLKLRYLTGKDQTEINAFGYVLGLNFIENIEEDEKIIAHIERSKPFWNWWRRQMVLLSNEFLHQEGVKWIEYKKETVWKCYKKYCFQMGVSQYGLKSFEFLAADILLPEYKKEKKESALINN